MSFYPEILQIGEELPKFTKGLEVTVEATKNTEIPQKIFRCTVCGTRFVHFGSFIKSCGNHLPEGRVVNDEVVQGSESLVVGAVPSIKIEAPEGDDKSGSSCDESSVSSSSESDGSESSRASRRSVKEKKRRKRSRAPLLPKDTILCCPICQKTFVRRQTYRDHMDAHENPLIKCCQICATEFSSGINANKHKKKFHPELYEQELKERAAERAKDGRKRNRLQPILIPIDPERPNILIPSHPPKIRPFKVTSKHVPRLKRVKIVVDRIALPGFLPNDWIYLPKKEEDYPWIVERPEKIKVEPDVVENEEGMDEGDDYDWPENDTNEWIDVKTEENDETKVPLKELYKNKERPKRNVSNSYFIQQEEIPHVPQFQGSKYIFGVYSERRYKKLKESKSGKKRGRPRRNRLSSDDDDNNEDDLKDEPERDDEFLKPTKNYYKSESKTCKICGVTRSNSNIRRHIAKHCVEENDTECRICDASFTVGNKLREHYSRVHKMKFREYLYNMQKEKMEKMDEESIGNTNTCDICYTNMRTEDDLRYHVEMLHCYKEGGGKNKGSLDCNICGKTFAAVQNRNLHIRRIHKQVLEGSVFCHYCGKDFMGKGFLLSHFRYAHFDKNGVFKDTSTVVKKRYKHPPKEAKTEDLAQHFEKYKAHSVCEICGLIKESRFAMMRHRYEKHGVVDPGYSKIIDRDREENDCQYCGKHFTSLRKWKDHEKYHLKEIPNLHCQVCGAKCKTETYLKAHMERHGEKKYFCDYEGCGKSFAVKHDVKIHKRRAHCDDLDYVCKICGTAFRTWNYRRYHEETVHGLVKVKQQRNKRRPLPQVAAALQQQTEPVVANTEATFTEQTTIQNVNFSQFTGFSEQEERDCQFCGKHFDDYRKWQNHEYYHKKINPDLACEICGAKCKTEYYLKAHMERHGEIKYFCEYPGCGKGFSVKHDVKIHQRRAHKDLPVQPDVAMVNASPGFGEAASSQIPLILPTQTMLYPYPTQNTGMGT